MTRILASTLSPKGLPAIWTILWKTVTFFLLWSILYAPFVVVLAPGIESSLPGSSFLLRLYFDISGALTILLAAWVMARFVERRSLTSLGFAPNHLARDVLLGVGIGSIWLATSLTVLWLCGWISFHPTGTLDGITLALAGMAMILNTVLQEVLARSYVFQTLRSQTNATWAIIVSSVLFMLYHIAGFQGAWLPAFNVFSAGVLFGVACYLTRNLWLAIAIHFAWNFMLGPVLGLSVSGQDLANRWRLVTVEGPALFTGGRFGIEGSLVVTVVTILAIAALLRWYPRQTT